MTRQPLLAAALSIGLLTVAPCVAAGQGAGRTAAPKGVPAPAAVRARPVRDAALVRTFNSIEILADSTLGVPALQVRVVGTWGDYAGQDSDALLTRVYVTINDGGTDLRAFALGQLLDPTIEQLATESDSAVIYLSYGLPKHRQQLRAVASVAGISIGPARGRR